MADPEDGSWPEGDPRWNYMPVLLRIEEMVASIRVSTTVGLVVLIGFVVAVMLLAGYVLVFRLPAG